LSRPDRFDRVQAARRIDWRFLLPEPDLGDVVCVGTPEPELLESLRLLSASVTVAVDGERRGAYDVAVLRNPSTMEIETAAQLLRPGGWVYIERSKAGPRVGRYVALLERHVRFEDVGAYWHWPDFDSCEAIAPLRDRAAVRYLLQRARREGAALKANVGLVILLLGAFAAVVPDASVIGRRPADSGQAD
jgi:hypothetical protein